MPAGYKLPIHLDGLEVNLDDGAAGVGNRGLVRAGVIGDGTGRDGVDHRSVGVAVCGMGVRRVFMLGVVGVSSA